MASDKLTIKGARVHNLRNISLTLPRNKLVVITGLSGSGKSSLAFDTIYAEGQRRYVESLSAYARQFLELMEKPDVDYIEGLSPAISIEQKTSTKRKRAQPNGQALLHKYGTERTPAESKFCRMMSGGSYLDTTLVACGPFWPIPSSNSTASPSLRVLKPSP